MYCAAVHNICQYVSWGARKMQYRDNLPTRRIHRATEASSVAMSTPPHLVKFSQGFPPNFPPWAVRQNLDRKAEYKAIKFG